jgi:hypothetical protein
VNTVFFYLTIAFKLLATLPIKMVTLPTSNMPMDHPVQLMARLLAVIHRVVLPSRPRRSSIHQLLLAIVDTQSTMVDTNTAELHQWERVTVLVLEATTTIIRAVLE